MTAKRAIAFALCAAGIAAAIVLRVRFEREVDRLSAAERAEAQKADAIRRAYYTKTEEQRAVEASRGEEISAKLVFQAECLAEHIEQIRSGVLEGVESGRLCWYCKKPHAWKDCVSK